MKLTEIKCKNCGEVVVKKKRFAKFCSDRCRKYYWSKFIEAREVCKDCGTLLGQHSRTNVKSGNSQGRCPRCATSHRIGTGMDF